MTEIPIFPGGARPENAPEYAEGDWHGLLRHIGDGLHGIKANLPDPRRARLEKAQKVWSIRLDPVPVPLVAGAGFLDTAQFFSPGLGYQWDVHTISATGFTAGSVSGWINLPSLSNIAVPQGALRFAASAAGYANYGKNQCWLRQGERLVFIATGITGVVLVSMDATSIADEYVGDYLT